MGSRRRYTIPVGRSDASDKRPVRQHLFRLVAVHGHHPSADLEAEAVAGEGGKLLRMSLVVDLDVRTAVRAEGPFAGEDQRNSAATSRSRFRSLPAPAARSLDRRPSRSACGRWRVSTCRCVPQSACGSRHRPYRRAPAWCGRTRPPRPTEPSPAYPKYPRTSASPCGRWRRTVRARSSSGAIAGRALSCATRPTCGASAPALRSRPLPPSIRPLRVSYIYDMKS